MSDNGIVSEIWFSRIYASHMNDVLGAAEENAIIGLIQDRYDCTLRDAIRYFNCTIRALNLNRE